mgnify:CR=1 FL=1
MADVNPFSVLKMARNPVIDQRATSSGDILNKLQASLAGIALKSKGDLANTRASNQGAWQKALLQMKLDPRLSVGPELAAQLSPLLSLDKNKTAADTLYTMAGFGVGRNPQSGDSQTSFLQGTGRPVGTRPTPDQLAGAATVTDRVEGYRPDLRYTGGIAKSSKSIKNNPLQAAKITMPQPKKVGKVESLKKEAKLQEGDKQVHGTYKGRNGWWIKRGKQYIPIDKPIE